MMVVCMINNVLQIYDFINCCLTCCSVESQSDSSFPYCEYITRIDVPAQCLVDIHDRNPVPIDFYDMCDRARKYKCTATDTWNGPLNVKTCVVEYRRNRGPPNLICDTPYYAIECCKECCNVVELSSPLFPYCGNLDPSDIPGCY